MAASFTQVAVRPRPLVSVLVPAYNGSGTILRTLLSVARQDYAPLELVVVDDGSTDGLSDTVREFLAEHAVAARLVRHEANEGLARTLNDGLRAAAGELVLILHQDIELLGTDWIRRAVAELEAGEAVQVVTCHYGIPATEEWTFAARAFGFLRRQFHEAPADAWEYVTFTEFKCDLARKDVLDQVGDFPENFRLAGEDIMVSYRIRRAGGKILKAYGLRVVQRFEGRAGSVGGNLWKEYRFGMALAGVFAAYGRFTFRGLGTSAYSRGRSLHRASQPPVALVGLALLGLGLVTGSPWAWAGLLALLAARVLYYVVRVAHDFRRVVPSTARAAAETLAAAALGLATDAVYPAGLAVGLVRSALGASV